jgi:transcription-repair coupling factor (superfamily II helicase)
VSIGRLLVETLDRAPRRTALLPHVDDPVRAYLAACLVREGRLPVVVAAGLDDAEDLHRDLAFLLGVRVEDAASEGLLLLADDERSPYEEYSPDQRVVMDRLNALYRLHHARDRVRAVVVTPHALTRRHVPPALFSAGDYLVSRERIDREKLLSNLVASGYNSVSTVEDPGTFSVRGGIIDIYSPHLPRPVRVDLFGDEIESLRTFDPATQRTVEELEDATILPARELVFTPAVTKHALAKIEAMAEEVNLPSKKLRAIQDDLGSKIHFFGIEALLPIFHPDGLVSLDAYLPKGKDVVLVLGEREPLEEKLGQLLDEAKAGYAASLHRHQLSLPPAAHLADGLEVLATLSASSAVLETPSLVVGKRTAESPPSIALPVEDTRGIRAEMLKSSRQEHGEDMLQPVTERLRRWRGDGYVNLLVAHTRGQAERLKSLLTGKGLQVRMLKGALSFDDLPGGTPAQEARSPFSDRSVHAWIILGDISHGFVVPAGRLAILSEEEIFGQRTKTRKTRRAPPSGAFVSDLAELRPGDFVVHIDHGIGKYHGIVRIPVNGVDSDFLHLEYKNGDKLYLPVHRLRLIQKFASAEDGKNPQVSLLGSQTWISTKAKVKDTLLKMAAELLRLYAVRRPGGPRASRRPTRCTSSSRPSSPTSPRPTSRRPSTTSCTGSQHLPHGPPDLRRRGLRQDRGGDARRHDGGGGQEAGGGAGTHHRAGGPALSRVQRALRQLPGAHRHRLALPERREQKRTSTDAAAGNLDIIIGTHRLLSKDVNVQGRGDPVIDEEHRFGVKHKEQLKKYRTNVHVLTMSATPIPRTMHMGMMGVRDLSVIATPPVDRLSVKTEVHKFSEEVIRDAVLQEIRRGGQCFVVHNRVASIDAFARMLEKLVPECRIIVGHGQMDEDQLEKVMVDFMNKHYNVLLSTTIIESGIDIANANTIIVNRADKMGLAQLYQLQGRVGREVPCAASATSSSRRAMSRPTRASVSPCCSASPSWARASRSPPRTWRSAAPATSSVSSSRARSRRWASRCTRRCWPRPIEELKGSGPQVPQGAGGAGPRHCAHPGQLHPGPSERLSYYQRFNRAESTRSPSTSSRRSPISTARRRPRWRT